MCHVFSLDGRFANLIPMVVNGADAMKRGEPCRGFDGDGLTDIFIFGTPISIRQRACVDKPLAITSSKSLESTCGKYGAMPDIINDGYDDVFATGYNQAMPSASGRIGLLEYKITDDWLATARVWLWGTSSITVKCKP